MQQFNDLKTYMQARYHNTSSTKG